MICRILSQDGSVVREIDCAPVCGDRCRRCGLCRHCHATCDFTKPIGGPHETWYLDAEDYTAAWREKHPERKP